MFKMLIAAIAAFGFSTAFAQGGTPPPAGETAPATTPADAGKKMENKKMDHKHMDHGKMKKEKKKKDKGEEAH
jgi:uncharacterized protein involved in copper resistance